MRHLTRCAVVLGLFFVVGCATYPFRSSVQYATSLDVGGISQVVVVTENGRIEVVCEPGRTTADVRASKSASGKDEADARRQAETIRISTERDPNNPQVLRVTATWPHPEDRNRGVDFHLSVPADAAFNLKTSNGEVTIAHAAREVQIDTSNGEISATNIAAPVHARTSNGSVTLHDIAGDVEVDTSNGAVHLTHVGKSSVHASTCNGELSAIELTGNADLSTSNGSLEARFSRVPAAPQIHAQTSNASVLVELPASANATVHLRTSNGGIDTKLDGVPSLRDLHVSPDDVSLTLNNGSGALTAESSNGSITLRIRPDTK